MGSFSPGRPERSRFTRRDLLTAVGTAGITSIAGCRSLTGPPQQQWTFDVESAIIGSPVLAAEAGFVTTRSRERSPSHVHAVDVASGESRWRASVPEACTAPRLRDDLVVIGTTAGLIALDRSSGAEQWRLTTNERVTAVATSPDGIYASADGLLAVDENGDHRWGTDRATVGPIAANSVTVVTTIDPDGAERMVSSFAPASGELRWQDFVRTGGFPVAQSIVRGDRVYTAGKRFTARDATTGDLRWSFDPGQRESLSTPPVRTTGLHVGTGVRFTARDYGTVFSLFDGELGYELRTDESVAALAGDTAALFVRVGDTVQAVDPDLMTTRWSVNLDRVGAAGGRGATLAGRDGTCLVAMEGPSQVVALSDT